LEVQDACVKEDFLAEKWRVSTELEPCVITTDNSFLHTTTTLHL